jgi:hypothetical protein
LKPLEGSLFCPTKIILKLHPDEIFCGNWNLERIENVLSLNGSYISDFYLKKLNELKEYFNEQK